MKIEGVAMQSSSGSYKVVASAAEAAAAAAGIGMSIATWQQYTTLSAGIAGIVLSLAMTFNYIYKSIAERKRVVILEREVNEKIRLDAQKAAEEKIRLDSYKEYVISHNDRRHRDLTPEQLFNELVKDEGILQLLKSRIISRELGIERDDSD